MGKVKFDRVRKSDRVLKTGISIVLVVIGLSSVCWFAAGFDLATLLPRHTLCPFRAVTAVPCPGCGTTRALLRAGQLRLRDAVELNPFALPLLAVMICFLSAGRIPLCTGHPSIKKAALLVVLLVWLTGLV